ncbi:hypothetical protein KC906_03305 [Candidatus Kaiserbacteria bacterium]|nr:hypothetical protein [Candidatus Kaiserbacteria bacterium]
MKRFLIVSTILLILAILCSIFVYILVTLQLQPSAPAARERVVASTSPEQSTSPASDTVPVVGVPLRDLPLRDTQRSTLETFGIDVETLVITPAMQSCAVEKLGDARMAEILAGAAPGILETAALLPCLSGE